MAIVSFTQEDMQAQFRADLAALQAARSVRVTHREPVVTGDPPDTTVICVDEHDVETSLKMITKVSFCADPQAGLLELTVAVPFNVELNADGKSLRVK